MAQLNGVASMEAPRQPLALSSMLLTFANGQPLSACQHPAVQVGTNDCERHTHKRACCSCCCVCTAMLVSGAQLGGLLSSIWRQAACPFGDDALQWHTGLPLNQHML